MAVLILLSNLELIINLLLSLVVLAMSVASFVMAVSTPARAFDIAYKRTKNFWLVVTGLCILGSLLSLGGARSGSSASFVMLVTATAAGVFLADVRPAVRSRR